MHTGVLAPEMVVTWLLHCLSLATPYIKWKIFDSSDEAAAINAYFQAVVLPCTAAARAQHKHTFIYILIIIQNDIMAMTRPAACITF